MPRWSVDGMQGTHGTLETLRRDRLQAFDEIMNSLWPCVSLLNHSANVAFAQIPLVMSKREAEQATGEFNATYAGLRESMEHWMQCRGNYREMLSHAPLPVLRASSQPHLPDRQMLKALRAFERDIERQAWLSGDVKAQLLKHTDDFYLTLAAASLQAGEPSGHYR